MIGYRVTPAEGLQVDEVYIPGDVYKSRILQLLHNRYSIDYNECMEDIYVASIID